MNMETAEKLPKHLNTAVNAIQKQIDKYIREKAKLLTKSTELELRAGAIELEITGLMEQIAKLKGE